MFGSNSAARRGQGYGYNILTEPGFKCVETDTFQCAHCNDTVFIDPKEPSPWCSCCNRQLCGRPQCRNCVPFMKKIEKLEAECKARVLLWREADNV